MVVAMHITTIVSAASDIEYIFQYDVAFATSQVTLAFSSSFVYRYYGHCCFMILAVSAAVGGLWCSSNDAHAASYNLNKSKFRTICRLDPFCMKFPD